MLNKKFYKNTTIKYGISIASVKSRSIVRIMRRLLKSVLVTCLLLTMITGIVWKVGGTARAVTSEPIVLLGQVKITSSSGQFITLYNNSASVVNMNEIKLVYYNNNDLSLNPTGKLISLSGSMQPGTYYLISDDSVAVCYKMTVNAMSLGFSSTAGMVQVIRTTQVTPGGIVATELLDSFAWNAWKKPTGSTATGPSSIQTTSPFSLPSTTAAPSSFLQRLWPAGGAAKTIGGGSWQTVAPSASDACSLQSIADSATPAAPSTPAATTTVAAAKIVTPIATNVGLVAPEITELFPNPKDPQTDDSDEFIELYNPNDSVFNLSGYRVEAGTSYSRGYTFKDEVLQPKSYAAFPITSTNLQLSNSEGQARLLSPSSDTLSETPVYEDAPEGSSWGIIGDSWDWLAPSPNVINSANVVPTSTDTKTAVAAKKTTGKVAAASTKTASGSTEELDDAVPLHPGVLAGVGLAAVAYAVYEYRTDMANRFFQARRYLRNRRAVRS